MTSELEPIQMDSIHPHDTNFQNHEQTADNRTIEMDMKTNDNDNHGTNDNKHNNTATGIGRYSMDIPLIDSSNNQNTDAFHIEINEKQWISCLPKVSLTAATIIGAILGIIVGLCLTLTNTHLSADVIQIIEFPGILWIRALTLLVLPLICLMMIILPSRVAQIGSIGKICIPLYLCTSLCASIQGTLWGWVIVRPGSHGNSIHNDDSMSDDIDESASNRVSELDAFMLAVENAVPDNIFTALANVNILGAITFFLTIGILLKKVDAEQRELVLQLSRAILKCCMMAVVWLIWLSPIGMLSIVMGKVTSTEDLPALMKSLGMYVLTMVVGQFIHLFVFYRLLFYGFTRLNSWKWFMKIYEAPLLAFATASSAATLPRSLQVAEKVGIRPEVYQFILPLGSCINMDGTALGFPIMIAFISQLNNVPQSIGTIILICVLSVIISVGAAPIPNAGMVYLLMLFRSANLEEFQLDAIATLFVLDWFVDRLETAVNVSSDQYIAKIVDVIQQKQLKKGTIAITDDGSI